MPALFDSSVVLSLLLKDSHADEAVRLWSSHEDRTASKLLEVECLCVLRRTAKTADARLPSGWLGERDSELATYLEEVSVKPIDDAVIELIRQEERLAGCRSRDAVHIATAILFQQASEDPFRVCTLDKRMAEMCERVGLAVAT